MSNDGAVTSPQEPMRQPIMDWLAANNIDHALTPPWPEIEFDEEAGVMRLPQYIPDSRGRLAFMRMGSWGDAGTMMVEKPLLVPMDAELRAMWDYHAPRARADLMLWGALRQLTGATVLQLHEGQRVIFVARGEIEPDTLTFISATLREALPGVNVDVVSGAQAVLLVDPVALPAQP